MNGIHDMGGMHGFGPVAPEANEPVFHAAWEGRVLALNRAMGHARLWNIDMSRFARENRPPEEYLAKSYYQIWLAGLERLMLERGAGAAALPMPAAWSWIPRGGSRSSKHNAASSNPGTPATKNAARQP